MGATVDSSQIPLSTSLWWETVFHKQVQCETPTSLTSPDEKPVTAWTPFYWVMGGGCAWAWCSTGFPQGHMSFRHIHLLLCGVLHGLQVDLYSLMDLYWLQGHSCLARVCILCSRRISALVASSPLIWVSAELFLPYIPNLLFQLLLCRFFFFSSLNHRGASSDRWNFGVFS